MKTSHAPSHPTTDMASSAGATATRRSQHVSRMLEQDEDSTGPRNIFEAAERGMVGYIVKAVERRLDFNVSMKDKFDRTALHWAAETNSIECAEALMDYGCDPSLTECNGRSPIHLAARNGHVEMLRTLMENMSKAQKEQQVNKSDIHGLTPVSLATQKGEESRLAFEFLMECGGHYNTNVFLSVQPGDEAVPEHTSGGRAHHHNHNVQPAA